MRTCVTKIFGGPHISVAGNLNRYVRVGCGGAAARFFFLLSLSRQPNISPSTSLALTGTLSICLRQNIDVLSKFQKNLE